MSLTLIEKKLGQLRGHIRLMFFSWGLAKLTIWGAALALWLFYTDLLLNLPGGMRVGFLVVALVILGVVAVRSLVYPLSRTISDEDLALLVEREYPLLNDRLISSLQILRSQERYKDAASEDMIRAVVGESFDIAGKLQFNDAVRSGRLLYMVMGSMIALGLLFGHAWFAQDAMSLWVRRALGAGPEWPTSTQLEVMILAREQMPLYPTNDDLLVNFTFAPDQKIDELGVTGVYEVASNSDLRFVALPSGDIPERATIEITTFQRDPQSGAYVQVGRVVERPMEVVTQEGAEGKSLVYFTYNKMSIINPLEQITIRAGDASAGPYTLRVIPAPELASPVELTFNYPRYLSLEAQVSQELGIDAVAGTQVEFRFSTTKPLMLEGPESSGLMVDFSVGSSQRFAIDTDREAGENHYRARIPALQMGMSRYRLRLVDSLGIENSRNIGDLVIVKEDMPPTVRVTFSGDPLVSNQLVYITRDAVIPIEFELHDDYGVGGARMFWRFGIESEFREYAPFALLFKELETAPKPAVISKFDLDFAALIGTEAIPTGVRPSIEVYIQAFDLNQETLEDGTSTRFQGSRHRTVLTYEIHDLDELRSRVSSRIRQIKSDISGMAAAQEELRASTRDALSRPNLLDFKGEEGERLRHDLDEAYKRQSQLLRDAEFVLSRFNVFAQVYHYNRLERKTEGGAKPQESHIQTVRLLLAIAGAERDLQQRINTPLVRLEEASDDDIVFHATELVESLRAQLLRAAPDRNFSADSFGKLVQETGLFSPGSMERARGLYESLLDVSIRPNERRELLVELQRQQEINSAVIRTVQEQVKKWEGFDDILAGLYNVLNNQKDNNDDLKKEVNPTD